VLWRFVQAIKDPENKGTDAKGLAQRLGYAVNGLIYGSLALSAVRLVLGSGGGGNRNAPKIGQRLLFTALGHWLVGTTGAFIIGLVSISSTQPMSAKFRKEMNLTQLSDTERKWVIGIGRFVWQHGV